MKQLSWAIVALALLSLVFTGCGRKPPVYPETGGTVESVQEMESVAREIAREVRTFRAQNGKTPLSWDDTLAAGALTHSQAMGSGRIPLGHHNFERRKTEITKSMGGFISGMAENVGVVQYSGGNAKAIAQQFVRLWAGSARHRQNMLGEYNITGVGVVRTSDGKVYATQLFARVGR